MTAAKWIFGGVLLFVGLFFIDLWLGYHIHMLAQIAFLFVIFVVMFIYGMIASNKVL